MKHLARILSLSILVSSIVFFAACDGDDGDSPSEKEAQIGKLVGTWKASSVTFEGDSEPYTTDYSAFKITITKSSNDAMTYTVSGRPDLSPWNANGTFSFGTPVTSQLERGDDVTVGYVVSGNSLQLTLDNYSGEGYTSGRIKTVAGDWVFNLVKE